MGSYPYPRNGILKLDYEFILIFKKQGNPPKVSKAKPHTYELKSALPEHIETKIIYYRKIDDGIEVDYRELL